jgi:hypothetical protein
MPGTSTPAAHHSDQLFAELKKGRDCRPEHAPLCEFVLDGAVNITMQLVDGGFSVDDGRRKPARRFQFAFEPGKSCLSIYELAGGGIRKDEASVTVKDGIVHRFGGCSDQPPVDIAPARQ